MLCIVKIYYINSETEFASSHSNSVRALLGDKSQ